MESKFVLVAVDRLLALLESYLRLEDNRIDRTESSHASQEVISVPFGLHMDSLDVCRGQANLARVAREVAGPVENTFVKSHGNHVLGVQLAVECGLKVAMCTKRLFDQARTSHFREQRNMLVVLNILRVEEHVPDGDDRLVDFEDFSSKNNSLGKDTGVVCVEECSLCNESGSGFCFFEENCGTVGEAYW
ncbi:hypothetical protein OGATHE_000696 [Ogataea polymorpha]|uniref:Uncharacterized protein n=1 Tax=Ogataea polymorpha TaxID=460523 RepID=A0A9P8PTL0_9ASCO|nr:hypothetical protein OGATHE_000696 [Ogataea polymorpha]